MNNREPLPLVYESTGVVTRFTDRHDPVPRSREVFSFPRPQTMQEWGAQPDPLRKRLHRIPPPDPTGLRQCQIGAIEDLEASFKADRPRALIQMATGSGKTFTAITAVYASSSTPTPSVGYSRTATPVPAPKSICRIDCTRHPA